MFTSILQAVPNDFEIDGGHPRPSITIPLAATEDGIELIAVEIRLWPGSWRGVAMHEFKFAIIHMNEDTGEVAEIFDRFMAAGYVESVRHLIMPCVCSAASALVKAVQPCVIYRATYFTRPAEKSLPKHQMITDTLGAEGYEVADEGTDQHGRQFWLMTKRGDT